MSSELAEETMPRKILAEVSLPTTCSFSSEEPPMLTLTLTLTSGPAIKIHHRASPFWPLVNCLSITNLSTGEPQQLPTMDIKFSSRSPPPTEDHHYTFLHPNVPHVETFDFRPFGHEIYTRERILAVGVGKYKLMRFGMHQFIIGDFYEIAVKKRYDVCNWEKITDENDSSSGHTGERTEEHEIIPVKVAPAVKFLVAE